MKCRSILERHLDQVFGAEKIAAFRRYTSELQVEYVANTSTAANTNGVGAPPSTRILYIAREQISQNPRLDIGKLFQAVPQKYQTTQEQIKDLLAELYFRCLRDTGELAANALFASAAVGLKPPSRPLLLRKKIEIGENWRCRVAFATDGDCVVRKTLLEKACPDQAREIACLGTTQERNKAGGVRKRTPKRQRENHQVVELRSVHVPLTAYMGGVPHTKAETTSSSSSANTSSGSSANSIEKRAKEALRNSAMTVSIVQQKRVYGGVSSTPVPGGGTRGSSSGAGQHQRSGTGSGDTPGPGGVGRRASSVGVALLGGAGAPDARQPSVREFFTPGGASAASSSRRPVSQFAPAARTSGGRGPSPPPSIRAGSFNTPGARVPQLGGAFSQPGGARPASARPASARPQVVWSKPTVGGGPIGAGASRAPAPQPAVPGQPAARPSAASAVAVTPPARPSYNIGEPQFGSGLHLLGSISEPTPNTKKAGGNHYPGRKFYG